MPDSQTLGLLAAAMVAAIVLFRLYTVLGRRTGHEPQPPVQRAPLTPVTPPAGDRAALRPLLSPDVYTAFDRGIAARSGPAPTLIKLHDARIVGSALHGRNAEVTAAFTAEFSGGDDKNMVTDVWTFERNLDSPDPNWSLVATSGELPE
jgi:Tim44-like domain